MMSSGSGVKRVSIRISQLYLLYRNVVLYLVIGGGAVVVDMGVFWILSSSEWDKYLANSVSTGVAMVWSFGLNSLINFKIWNRVWLRFLSFSLVSLSGYLLTSLMLFVMAGWLQVDSVTVKLLSLPIVVALQYALNSRITFVGHNSQ